MKITKKIFNKILFAVIVALVFSFINRCSVKAAVLGDNLVYGVDYDIYQIEVDNLDNTWQLVGTVMTSNSNYYKSYNFLINRNNKSLFGVGLPNAQYLNVIDFNDFEFENYAVYSASSFNQNPKIILSSGMLPVFGGNCSSGSYCYNFINTGSQGTGSSATIYSDTIYIDDLTLNGLNRFTSGVYNSDGILTDHIFYPYGKKMSCTNSTTGCYVGTGSPSSQWGFSSQNNSNSIYFTSSTLKNYSNYEPVNQIVAERQEPVIDINYNIDFVTINSSDNSQEEYGNDLTITSLATAIKYSSCDNELYNYYYGFIENSNDDIDWVQVNDNKCIGSYVANKNGYLLAKIEDKNGGFLYSKTFNIRNVGTLSTFAVNNNKFSTFLTDISSNINYGGPISGLTTIPINLMSTLYNSFNGTCSAYNLGSILGHNVVINCFTLESILGSSITGVIDMLCAFGIYYHLVLLIISIYRKVMNLDDLDDYLPQHMYHPQHGSYEDLHS